MKGKKTETGGSAAPDRGAPGFEAYYSSIWGERWPLLREALGAEASPEPWSEGLERPYLLDAASVFAALALGRPEDEECLDLCAAPGGKSLVLASRMGASRLLCNERSADRFFRLKRVLAEHLPPAVQDAVHCVRGEGGALCRKRPASFGRILLDAPCSSERHVLASGSHLEAWSPTRARSLPVQQWALLSSAFLMLKPGGRLVYATCSVNPAENEGVFGRLFNKYRGEVEELDPAALVASELPSLPPDWARRVERLLEGAERRGRGLALLPDRLDGAGPIYVAAASRMALTRSASSDGL